MPIYVYIGMCYLLVCACPYLHIFTYSFGSYRGLFVLYFVFQSTLSLHCNIYILYKQRSSCTKKAIM